MNRIGQVFSLLLIVVAGCGSRDNPSAPASQPSSATGPLAEYAGSESCAPCHKQAYDEWKGSHHANAQRDLSTAMDDPCFVPARQIKSGTQVSTVEKRDKLEYPPTTNYKPQTTNSKLPTTPDRQTTPSPYVFTSAGRDGKVQDFIPTAALGVFPLWQYIIPGPNGIFQLTEMAWDPAKKEWFNVYGDEDRKPGEWGHWTGRGMAWNSMCAPCHTTAFQKNYDPANDTYKSTYVEQGVGCESCHGPLRKHVEFQKAHPDGGYFGDKTVKKLSADQYLAVCGACHSRHGDMTGKFEAGEEFFDHFDPALPDASNVFYPDGQIWDEDFEHNVFMLSYMHDAGIRCNNCHSPHTSKPRKQGNELCLDCHKDSMNGRIVIDPLAHGFHPLDKGGSLCTDCHYPQTPYMQRHWRHDHGMTIPDPLLTKEHDLPNACNRCHKDKTVDWSIEWVDKWYGKRMDRPTRQRARVLAKLKKNDASAVPEAIKMLPLERNAAWRAVYLKLLAPWVYEAANMQLRQAVHQAMFDRLNDTAPLAQAAAIEALEPLAEIMPERFSPLLQASHRLVRVKAAWALRHQLDLNSPTGQELSALLTNSLDQPTGAFRWANYLNETGKPQEALTWYAKAVEWDAGSAPFRHGYAVALSRLQRFDDALDQLRQAEKVAPRDGIYPHSIGLLLAELGRLKEATDELRKATNLDPNQPRFWYNLGLAENQSGDANAALAHLEKAESLDPSAADYPYTRATIYLNLDQRDNARAAAQQTLRIDPTHAGAQQLLKDL